MSRPDHRKRHHVPEKEHERYWDPLFLKLPAQDVYQEIVIRSCNVQKCRHNLIFQMKSRFDLGGQHRQAVRRSITLSKAKLGPR
jgi:hypothetical protein